MTSRHEAARRAAVRACARQKAEAYHSAFGAYLEKCAEFRNLAAVAPPVTAAPIATVAHPSNGTDL